jgi:hypothetical protein
MFRSAVIVLMLALAGCAGGGSRSLKIKGPDDNAKRVPINKVYPTEAQTGVQP